jgi:hypothetical protein
VVHAREYGDATFTEQRFKALHGFFNGVLTHEVNKPVLLVRTHIDFHYFFAIAFIGGIIMKAGINVGKPRFVGPPPRVRM